MKPIHLFGLCVAALIGLATAQSGRELDDYDAEERPSSRPSRNDRDERKYPSDWRDSSPTSDPERDRRSDPSHSDDYEDEPGRGNPRSNEMDKMLGGLGGGELGSLIAVFNDPKLSRPLRETFSALLDYDGDITRASEEGGMTDDLWLYLAEELESVTGGEIPDMPDSMNNSSSNDNTGTNQNPPPTEAPRNTPPSSENSGTIIISNIFLILTIIIALFM